MLPLHRMFGPVIWGCLGVLALSQPALASCGAESCSLENGAFGGGYKRFTFEASFQTVNQDQAQIGTRSARIGEIPGRDADEVRTRSRTVLFKGQWSATPRLVTTVTLPYIDRLHSHFSHDHAPGDEPPLHVWKYSGIGDLTALASFRAFGRGDETTPLTASVQAGVKLPTGRRHLDPIDGDEPEPHARLGTGSVDVSMGAHLVHLRSVPTLSGASGTLPLFANVAYTLTNRGTENYRVGSMFDASTGASYPLGDRVQVLGQVNLRVHAQDEEEEAGGTQSAILSAHALNTGGTALYASPGLRFQAASLVSHSAYVQVPLYQRVNGIQLVAPYYLWLGATYRMP